MAKFIMDDEGKETMSGDKFMDTRRTDSMKEEFHTPESFMKFTSIKQPSGRCNSFKISKIDPYDLLIQIQNNIESKCVIRSIVGHDVCCPYNDPDVTEKLRTLIGDKITDKVRTMRPKKNDETDEEYEDSLLYWYMEMFYHNKLKTIKCESCIRKWLITDKW